MDRLVLVDLLLELVQRGVLLLQLRNKTLILQQINECPARIKHAKTQMMQFGVIYKPFFRLLTQTLNI